MFLLLANTTPTDSTNNKIYINESLLAATKMMFRQTRDKYKSLKILSCYYDGIIYARKMKDGDKIMIDSLREINLISKANRLKLIYRLSGILFICYVYLARYISRKSRNSRKPRKLISWVSYIFE